jgi:hypothetical protein
MSCGDARGDADAYDLWPVQGARSAPNLNTALASDILASGAATYAERNKVYGDNYRMVAPIMKVLFPYGVPARVIHSDKWHMFELLVVKITRFATSKLEHIDSIHDAMVYAAMIEASIKEEHSQ